VPVYSVSSDFVGKIYVQAGASTIQILRIDAGQNSLSGTLGLSRLTSPTVSGGSALVATPLRDGDPASATTAVITPTTVGGTSVNLAKWYLTGRFHTLELPDRMPMTIAPGNAFVLDGQGTNYSFTVYFAE
jgi:hypothetical protein